MKLTLEEAPKIFHSGPELPSQFFTREGVKVEIAGDIWVFPLLYRHSRLDLSRVENEVLKTSIKRRIIDQASRVSTHAGCQCWSDISAAIVSRQKKHSLLPGIPAAVFQERLIALMEDVINQARNKHRLWALYRPIQWYIWCSENYSELGFSIAYAQELDALEIPGNPKGEAVREEDPESGPLHRTLELQPIINALKQDQSKVYEHLQQKAAVALSIAFGRNPANLTFLKETDFVNLAPNSSPPCYVLKMPRIKKRQLAPRDDMIDEYLEPEIAKHVLELIDVSKHKKLLVEVDEKAMEVPKPLFINPKKNAYAIDSKRWDEAYNMLSTGIANLLKAFIKRHSIISPLTGELLHVTPRRLRYTLATGLAAEGISKRELARILDHTDTQHVDVYFEMAGRIVAHLDKAMAKGFSKYLNFFKGRLIDSDEDAVNGERDDKHLTFVDDQNPADQADIGVCGESSVCHLDPPYSCYLCPKFQPYRRADHEHVLDCLLAGREERLKKYENARLGIQLDEVIAAVAQVAKLCEVGAHNV
ncbi:site-specific integrase [Cronobacter sakazakii]|uniref:Site-specific integrase n=1 Tax=Cronobacter sakazakii TaxID=28141 RepID=A0AAN5WZB9_CROSK|nr:site-specific integrase [Cronobacter sakazakii]EJG0811430.1 site-specific integrase [Cronobacter sakazakii]KAB0874874.1 site-specific integrase [Cronobacter sakazakii]